MNRMNTRKYKLLQAALTSGCLIMPGIVFGDCYINNNPNMGTCNDPPYNGPPYVFPQDNITVTITGDGQIQQAGPGLDIIGNNNIIDIQSGPGTPLAIDSDDDGIQVHGENTTINIGNARQIAADNDGINVTGSNTVINNSGIIFGGVNGANQAIEIDVGAKNAIINNLSTGIIYTDNVGADAIQILEEGATITNSGKIISAQGDFAIDVQKSFKNITNNAGGLIESSGDGIIINKADITGNIINSGTIQVTANGNAINITDKLIGNITNNAAGIIQTTDPNATGAVIFLDNSITNLNNSGKIIATGTAQAIDVNKNISGNIINNTGGEIISEDSTTIFIANGLGGSISNSGEIGSIADSIALEVAAGTITGKITNTATGAISTGKNHAISLSGLTTIDELINNGTIQNDSAGKATIFASGNTTITNHFTNTGTIENLAAGSDAIDFSEPGVDIKLVQNSGDITGHVKLSGVGGANFDMNGGTIIGTVTEQSNASNILNLNGGSITGSLFLGDFGDTLNLFGTNVTGIIQGGDVNDTVNITGGSYNSLDGGAGNNILNIDSTFTTTGPISKFQEVNVNSGAFSVNHQMSDINDSLNITASTTLNANAGITGAGDLTVNGTLNIANGVKFDLVGVLGAEITGAMNVNSNDVRIGPMLIDDSGSLNIASNSIVNVVGNADIKGASVLDIKSDGKLLVNGNYTQDPGTTLNVELSNPSPVGPTFIDVTGNATFEANSNLYASVGGVPIQDGAAYDILFAPGVITDNGLLVNDSSASLSFSKNINGNVFQLIANTVPFANVISGSEITEGVANALDNILSNGTNNQDLNNLIGQLQTLGTADEVEDALRMLVPNYNHSLAANSIFAVHRAFDDIGIRLEELLGLYPLLQDSDVYRDDEDERSYNYYNRYGYGYNYGDGDGSPLMRHSVGSWVKPYASIIDQRKRETVDGYKADSVGFSAGADWRILDWATIGVAFNYGKTDVTQRGMFDNKQKINSYQLTFYGHFDPMGPIYVNTLLGLGRHGYKTNRAISVGTLNQVAQADFHGLHYAAKLEIGYAWFNGKYYVSPLVSMRYTRLEFDNYTDDGAGGLNLSTRYEPVTELLGSLGIKLAMKNEYLEAVYVPELAAYINYDFQQDRQETLNNFLGGGPSFKSYGIKPAQTSFIVSPSLRMHSYRNFMFKISYEFEAKKQFIAHSAYLKWYYKWD